MVSRPRVDRPEDDIAKFFRRVDRTEVTAPLRSSSVHDGRTRFVGPLSILIEGSARADGTILVNGYLQGAGELDWTGLWNLIGDGKIFGVVEVLADGKIIVGSGAAQIIIDGATGRILAGGMEIDPTDGGSVTFPGGAVVTGFTGGGVMMKDGDSTAVVSEGLVRIALGATGVWIDGFGLRVTGMPTVAVDDAPDGAYIGAVISDPFGMLRRVVA